MDWLEREEQLIADVEAEMVRLQSRINEYRTALNGESGTHPRESGAVRRASMDLTRALARYRYKR